VKFSKFIRQKLNSYFASQIVNVNKSSLKKLLSSFQTISLIFWILYWNCIKN